MNRLGKTTRRIDKLIQLLFNNIGKEVIIIDSGCYPEDYPLTADKIIRNISLRLRNEHNIYINNKVQSDLRLVKHLRYTHTELIGIDEDDIKEDYNRIKGEVLFRTLKLIRI